MQDDNKEHENSLHNNLRGLYSYICLLLLLLLAVLCSSPTWNENVDDEQDEGKPFSEHGRVDEGLLCHRHGARWRLSKKKPS